MERVTPTNGSADTTQTTIPMKLYENHFFSLPSQGNIYTLVPLKGSGNSKILIASLQKKILCIEYRDGKYVVTENPLTSIPNGADIISLNAYSKNGKYDIGLTMILKDGCEKSFLNFYDDWDIECSSSFDDEATGFSSLQLSYIPYHLYHTVATSVDGWEVVWLLTGSDRLIHMYRRASGESNQYMESSTLEAFPEFSSVHGITLHIDILYSENKTSRFTLTSGETGNIHLYHVDLTNHEEPRIQSSREINFDYPGSAVKLFYPDYKVKGLEEIGITPGSMKETGNGSRQLSKPLALITTTLESSFVQRFDGKFPCAQLVDSENFDVVTSCLVVDLDFDGKNEILIGTYGQVVLIYKENPPENWTLHQTLSLPSPVLALAFEDVLGDGVRELIVSTMKGLHIFQIDPQFVSNLLLERLRKLSFQR